MPLIGPPPGKHQMPTSAAPMSALEGEVLGGLDLEKLSDLAEVLFAINNYRIGPMPGFYVAVEVTQGKEWCVGQLCADRAKPLKLFDRKVYKNPATAQRAAERLREKDLAAMHATMPKKAASKKATTPKKARRKVAESAAGGQARRKTAKKKTVKKNS